MARQNKSDALRALYKSGMPRSFSTSNPTPNNKAEKVSSDNAYSSLSEELNNNFAKLYGLIDEKVKGANTSEQIKALKNAINAPVEQLRRTLDKTVGGRESEVAKKEMIDKTKIAVTDFVDALRKSNLLGGSGASDEASIEDRKASNETDIARIDENGDVHPVEDDYVEFSYQPGDTFGQKILDLGLATNNGLWGDNGDVAYYTRQLIDQGALDERGNVKLGQTFRLKRRK